MKGAIFTSFEISMCTLQGSTFLPSPTFVAWYSFPAVNSGLLISSLTPIAPQRSRKEAWEITFIHAYACEHTSQGTNSSFHQTWQFSSTVLLNLSAGPRGMISLRLGTCWPLFSSIDWPRVSNAGAYPDVFLMRMLVSPANFHAMPRPLVLGF